MKISNKPTDTILAKASNNSDVFNISHCVIHVDQGVLENWIDMLQIAKNAYEMDSDFSYGFWYGANVEFVDLENGNGYEKYEDVINEFPEDKDWVWVEYNEETEELPEGELRLEGPDTKVYAGGVVQFTAWGKHDGSVETWSESINVQEIKKAYEQRNR